MKWLITGGAGFIGCNTAVRLAAEGHRVVILDTLSRKGSALNLEWLQQHGQFDLVQGDVRHAETFEYVFQLYPDIDVVLHLAAQVAVTTSVTNPRADFEINCLGTFNLLEAVRKHKLDAIVLNASTNKVFGKLEGVRLRQRESRYEAVDLRCGVSEEFPLDFHSPYGCSKGAADQYVRDYARIYGLRTVSFRQSCIYGRRQFGVEDQGWVAWFAICAVLGRPICLYGDGRQVRDVLFIDDLADCYLQAAARIDATCGRHYNIGGGPRNTVSLLELIRLLEQRLDKKVECRFADWRPGDQKFYVSDIRRAARDFGWQPRTRVEDGVAALIQWVSEHRDTLRSVEAEGPPAETAIPVRAGR
jgi:CDP-paratose 2-epimerase